MQSAKKHRKPKKEKVNAQQFATAYAASVGQKDKAIANTKHLASVARNKATDATLSKDEQKEYLKTANFWDNIGGHINKLDMRQ